VALAAACDAAPGSATCKYNTGAGFVALTGTVATGLSYDTAWSSPDTDVASLFKVRGSLAGSVAGSLSAVVAVGLLTPGSAYTLRLTATDSDGSAGYAEVTLTMNTPPESGSVVVSPAGGYALKTAFTFAAVEWVEEDLPLMGYSFGTVGVNGDGTLDEATMLPFGGVESDASYVA
jgi:hypothetical protein